MKKVFFPFFIVAVFLTTISSFACDMHEHHTEKSEDNNKPHDYYSEVMSTMHNEMMIEPTGNVDVDFMRGMIPHHQGAVSMAEVVLKHGQDPEIRELAQEVIKTQQAEIEMMKAWLKEKGYEYK